MISMMGVSDCTDIKTERGEEMEDLLMSGSYKNYFEKCGCAGEKR